MLSILRKYSCILFFYLAIVGMVLLASARVEKINDQIVSNTYAINN